MAVSIDPALLVGLVISGVSLVVATTHWFGGSERARLTDEDALRRYASDHDDLAVDVVVADDGHAALIGLESGPPGLVFTLGSHVVTRPAGSVVAVRVDDGALVLDLADFSAPRPIRVGIADGDVRERWLQRLRHTAEGA